jgi:hypothetical protein
LLDLYLNTAVWFRATDGRCMQTLPGQENTGVTLSELMFGNESDVWIITAQNPESSGTFLGKEGEEVMVRLGRELVHNRIYFEPVTCGSPDRLHLEESFALQTKNQEEVAVLHEIARKYSQNAVFRFAGSSQQVVSIMGNDFNGEVSYKIVESKEEYCG